MALNGRRSVSLPAFVVAAVATWLIPVGARAGQRPFTPAEVAGDASAAAHLEGPGGQYLYDDGRSENVVGLTAGGELAWIHAFRVSPGMEVVTSVLVAYGTPTFPGQAPPPGTPSRVFVWDDPNNDGNPADARLLATANTIVQNPDTDILNEVPVPETYVGAAGDWFFIGASSNQAPLEFPAPEDTSTGSNGNAWVAGSNTPGGFDPNNLTGGIGLFNLGWQGGKWLLRANAVPEPCAAVLLLAAFVLRPIRRSAPA